MSLQRTASTGIAVGETGHISADWDTLHSAASAPIFSRSDWLSLLTEHFKRKLVFVLQYSDDGAAKVGIPLCISRRGPLTISSPLPISLYSGLVHVAAATVTPGLLEAVETKCNFCVLQLPPESETALFKRRGWTLLEQKSRILRISDPESLWAGYSQSLRRKIRRANDRKYQCTDDVSLDQMIVLYERSYARHRLKAPLASSQMRRWLMALLKLPEAHVYGARCPDGSITAFRIILRDGERTYDWLAGNDNVHTYPGASHWLVHEVLRREAAGGSRSFDFMGMNTPGVRNFKELFGGEDIAYTVASWHRPSVLKGIELLRRQLTQLRREYR